MITKQELRDFDYIIVLCVLFIFLFGLLSQYSASFQRGELLHKNFALMQIVWVLLGAAAAFLILNVSYNRFIEFAYPLYALGIALLVLVLVFGRTTYGAKRWLDLGIISFQPSEFAKIATILALAKYLGQINNRQYTLAELILPCFIAAAP
ncbi:MAG: FtsW/RodA/SpoVE family cell cycle protein, partial [Candidatus Omnitrophota bacterium]